MFDKLMLSKGGGIIAVNQKADQGDKAVIAIGLGGTGIECLKELKKEVYDRVKPDAGTEGNIPEYKRFKFLAIDTDEIGDEFDDIEKIPMKQENIAAILKRLPATKKNDKSLKWLGASENLKPRNNDGAGGVRQIGRICLFNNSTTIINRIKTMIEAAITDHGNVHRAAPDIYFHIFTGMCGGTGSGCFLDICYMIRGILEELNLTLKDNNKLLGYFFLPDFNLKIDDEQYKESNGYAAMQELDYCMNYYRNGDKWVQMYNGLSQIVSTDSPPVDYAHIISKKQTIEGRLKMSSNPEKDAINSVVDYVLEFMTKTAANNNIVNNDGNNNAGNNSTNNNGANKKVTGFTLNGHLSNINQHVVGVTKNYGTVYNYCVIGAARAYLPYKDINTYAASKIFDSFKYLKNVTPNKDAVLDLMKNSHLTLEDIESEIGDGVPTIIPPEPTVEEVERAYVSGQITDHTNVPMCINKISGGRFLTRAGTGSSIIEDSEGIIRRNAEALKGISGGIVVQGQHIKALTERIKDALEIIMKDPQKGPYYARACLSGNTEINITSVIYGYMETINQKLNNARATYMDRMDKVNTIISDVLPDAFNARFFAGNKKREAVESYVNAMVSMFKQEIETEKLEKVKEVLEDLVGNNKLIQIDNYLKKYTDWFDELYKTFDDNLDYLSPGNNARNNDYAFKIIDINEDAIKTYLDNQIAELIGNNTIITQYISGLLLRETDCSKAKKVFGDDEIVNFTKDFFIRNIDTITNNTLTTYFQIKHGTTDKPTLRDLVKKEIIEVIGRASMPNMWLGETGGVASFPELGFITYPESVPVVGDAVEDYIGNDDDMMGRPSYLTDSISAFRFMCGVPLYSYTGNNTYRKAYADFHSGNSDAGSHLYEYSEEDPRDFRNIKTVIPLRMLKEFNDLFADDKERKSNNSFIAELDEYYDKVISTSQDGNVTEYVFKKYNKDKIEEYERIVDEIKSGKSELSDNREFAIEVEDENNILSGDEPIKINLPIGGIDSNLIKDIIKDLIYSSMVYEKEFKTQISNYREYEKVLTGLSDIKRRISNLNDFVDAFSRGLIERASEDEDKHKIIIKYYKDIDDEEYEPIVLSTSKDKYGEKFELYSAFKTFEALDEKVKKSIALYIDEKMKGRVDPDKSKLAGELASEKEDRNKRIKAIEDIQDQIAIESFYDNIKKANDRL